MADQLTLGFLGGTGPQGRGLGLRFAVVGHEVLIGSRNAQRAESVVTEMLAGRDLPIRGLANADAAAAADVVFLIFPFEGQTEVLPNLAGPIGDKVVVDVINPLAWDERGACPIPISEGSAAQQAQALLPRARVTAAFHHAPLRLLADLDRLCETDVLVVGDDPGAREVVIGLANEIPGCRGIDAGPLRLAGQLEGFTAVIVGVNRRYKVHAGIRITRLSEERLEAMSRGAGLERGPGS